MYILSIHFISFTAQIYNALHMQGKKRLLALWDMAPLPPLNPRMVRQLYCSRHI